jgi:hypothetical protein
MAYVMLPMPFRPINQFLWVHPHRRKYPLRHFGDEQAEAPMQVSCSVHLGDADPRCEGDSCYAVGMCGVCG